MARKGGRVLIAGSYYAVEGVAGNYWMKELLDGRSTNIRIEIGTFRLEVGYNKIPDICHIMK
jgi:hypothetical protein